MDLRLLQAFVAVAGRQAFGAAARDLSLSQPALTKQIQALERSLGGAVFTRGRHGASLTTLGRSLLPEATDVVHRAERLDHRIRRLGSAAEGALAIGFGLSSIETAPRLVAQFRDMHPGIDISLDDMSSAMQFDGLASGALDLGFTRLPAPAGLESLVLHQDRLALATPAHWPEPPAGAPALSTWLDGRPVVRLTAERGPGLAAQAEALCTHWGCRPIVLQEASDLQTVLALVSASLACALVPASAAGVAPVSVRILPLPGAAAAWNVGLVWNPNAPSRLVGLFVESVRSGRGGGGGQGPAA